MRFEWDENKNRTNLRKHGIDFREASEVFIDPLHVSIQDRIVSQERRWQTTGMVRSGALVVVAHTLRLANDGIEVTRIISARRPERHERKAYEG